MPLPTLFGDDEELGKKDDDYRTGHEDLILSDVFQLPSWKVGPRTRRRRAQILGGVAVLLILALLWARSGHSSNEYRPRPKPRTRQPPPVVDLDDLHPAAKPNTPATPPPPRNRRPPKGPPPEPELRDGRELQYYNGPLTWHALPFSLQAANRRMAGRLQGRNVLFAAANLQSLGRLAPMACEMARWHRSVVHIAVMGRHDMKMSELREINGVDESCEAVWHDARPDYAAYSTDDRFGLSVFWALDHFRSFLQPQVYIIDQVSEEEPRFVQSAEDHANRLGKTLIRLPTNAAQTLKWFTRLDHGSLAAWNNAYVEILVRAPVGNSASLIRLLKSIQSADYFGARHPHLTIELPPDLDRHTEQFLDNFVWPPLNRGEYHKSFLTLRRRLPQQRVGIAEANMRLIESFYPSRSHDAHVLLLAAEVELSPLYYHYLLYNLLEYRYSSYNHGTREADSMLGISLISPTHLLDGTTKLLRPTVPVEGIRRGRADDEELTTATPFLWQAPDTFATLYFGDKWKQLYSFFDLRLRRTSLVEGERHVTSALPAFAEYVLELMRARGYFILYPHLPNYDFATAHNELYQPPEEFVTKADAEPPTPADASDPFYHPGPTSLPVRKEEELALAPLDVLLPDSGDLAELAQLPVLSYNGQRFTVTGADRTARAFAREFRSTVGKCAADEVNGRADEFSATDLFCGGLAADDSPVASVPAAGVTDGTAGAGLNGHGGGTSTVPVANPWVDEDGDWLPLPIADSEKTSMKNEFSKHLERQKGRSS